METIELNTEHSVSKIIISESIANLEKDIPSVKKAIIITDENILKHYDTQLAQLEHNSQKQEGFLLIFSHFSINKKLIMQIIIKLRF